MSLMMDPVHGAKLDAMEEPKLLLVEYKTNVSFTQVRPLALVVGADFLSKKMILATGRIIEQAENIHER